MDLLREIATNAVAVYGAALSTLLAVIRILEWIQNRPRVVVQWSLSQLPSNAPNPPRTAIAFWAHNFGARPTTLISFFYIIPRKKTGVSGKMILAATGSPIPGGPYCQVVPPFPARLDPGGMVTVYWAVEHIEMTEEVTWPYALVGFRDARGRAYYCVGGLRGWWLRRQARRR